MTENIKCPNCGSGNIRERDSDDERNWFCYTCLCDWPEHERQPPNAWIACSERLPEIHTPVLVYGTYHTPHVMSLAFDGAWHQPKALEYETITHWQPLPEPPETEKQTKCTLHLGMDTL